MKKTKLSPPNSGGAECTLSTDPIALRTEFAKRRLESVFRSVPNSEVNGLLEVGWIPFKQGKTRTRLHRPKQIDHQLKDDIWSLMYRMGYSTLNLADFPLDFDQGGSRKFISVVAEDDETVVVVECRSREDRGRKSLAKDLAESKLARRSFQRLVSARQKEVKRKILWIYATRNIIWSEKDVNEAADANIRVLTENEFQYFDSFIGYMGPAGRYQFLAEYFQGQDIPGLEDVRVPATQGVFGKQRFYSFVTTPRRLLKIAFVNHQALNHPDGRPAYQRMISPGRIKGIQHFIEKGGYFPTNILLNFTRLSRFDLLPRDNSDPHIKFGWLYLPKSYKSAWVIDGQHRLYGYSHLSGRFLDQPIPVIAFELLSPRDEAELFVTINHEQKQVPKSVLVGLQADLKINSTVPRERLGALASAIAKELAADPTSPFFQRFAVHGVQSVETQSLTVPEVVNGLVRAGLIGRIVQGTHVPGPLSAATDERTIRRAQAATSRYFHALREANPARWEMGRDGCMSTNPGVRAFLLLLAECCNYLQQAGGIDPFTASAEELVLAVTVLAQPVLKYFETASDVDIKTRFSRKFGEGGVRDYFENLAELVTSAAPDFGSEDLRKGLALKKDKRRAEADTDVIALSKDLLDTVTTILKATYGENISPGGEKDYWRLGVESKKIKAAAYHKHVEDNGQQPPEAYLDIIDLKEIVKQKSNWPRFEHIFNIPLPGEKGRHQYLEWMDRFNVLRRIPAHPSGSRTYTEEDYEFLTVIKAAFYGKRASDDRFGAR